MWATNLQDSRRAIGTDDRCHVAVRQRKRWLDPEIPLLGTLRDDPRQPLNPRRPSLTEHPAHPLAELVGGLDEVNSHL
jgi:hypothetical protein